jgi:hypothetical protein
MAKSKMAAKIRGRKAPTIVKIKSRPNPRKKTEQLLRVATSRATRLKKGRRASQQGVPNMADGTTFHGTTERATPKSNVVALASQAGESKTTIDGVLDQLAEARARLDGEIDRQQREWQHVTDLWLEWRYATTALDQARRKMRACWRYVSPELQTARVWLQDRAFPISGGRFELPSEWATSTAAIDRAAALLLDTGVNRRIVRQAVDRWRKTFRAAQRARHKALRVAGFYAVGKELKDAILRQEKAEAEIMALQPNNMVAIAARLHMILYKTPPEAADLSTLDLLESMVDWSRPDARRIEGLGGAMRGCIASECSRMRESARDPKKAGVDDLLATIPVPKDGKPRAYFGRLPKFEMTRCFAID